MANDLNQSSHVEDDLELLEILKIAIEYKKLIISTVLIFTIASIIYSNSMKTLYETSVNLEIGYFTMKNGNKELIESASDLISALNILILKNQNDKFSQHVSINSFEGKIIRLETISNSAEQNKSLLNEVIEYIDDRNDDLSKSITSNKINNLSIDIEKTKAEIDHFNSKLSEQYQLQYTNIISNLPKANQAGEKLKLLIKNSEFKDILFYLNQNLEMLIQNREMLNSQVFSNTKIIKKFDTKITKSKKQQLIIPLGLIMGIITSVFLVFFNILIKNYRNSLS